MAFLRREVLHALGEGFPAGHLRHLRHLLGQGSGEHAGDDHEELHVGAWVSAVNCVMEQGTGRLTGIG